MRYDARDREIIQTLPSGLFTWLRESASFVGEASTLEHELERLGWRRLNYQQGEWGFHMRSDRTGDLVWFRRERENRDADNDLVSVEFVADHPTAVRLTVFND